MLTALRAQDLPGNCCCMQQAQADKSDDWAFCQARKLRQAIVGVAATQLETAGLGAPPAKGRAPGGRAGRGPNLTKYHAPNPRSIGFAAAFTGPGEQYMSACRSGATLYEA